jgi:triosephosphate isomerase
MKTKKIIIGNWKMAPKTSREAGAIFQNIRSVASKMQNVQTVLCVPSLYISSVQKKVTGHRCVVGAQDVSMYKDDAHTGEVSATMLKDSNVAYTIVGHSERRAMGETSEHVAEKATALTKEGIRAIVCVGESQRDDEGEYTHFIKAQLLESLKGVPKKNLEQVIVAYEPVWAIGKKAKREATIEDVREMSIFLRRILVDEFGQRIGSAIPILYGGSVNQKNTAGYLFGAEVDGLLIGRASLKPDVFKHILHIANNQPLSS